MRDFPVSGSIQRHYSDHQGQHLVLVVVGALETLQEIENRLLNSQPYHWSWTTLTEEPRREIGNRGFIIKTNSRQAEKGTNSDSNNEFEYESVSGSSRSSPSISSKMSGESVHFWVLLPLIVLPIPSAFVK
jgi:hypothetical protein